MGCENGKLTPPKGAELNTDALPKDIQLPDGVDMDSLKSQASSSGVSDNLKGMQNVVGSNLKSDASQFSPGDLVSDIGAAIGSLVGDVVGGIADTIKGAVDGLTSLKDKITGFDPKAQVNKFKPNAPESIIGDVKAKAKSAGGGAAGALQSQAALVDKDCDKKYIKEATDQSKVIKDVGKDKVKKLPKTTVKEMYKDDGVKRTVTKEIITETGGESVTIVSEQATKKDPEDKGVSQKKMTREEVKSVPKSPKTICTLEIKRKMLDAAGEATVRLIESDHVGYGLSKEWNSEVTEHRGGTSPDDLIRGKVYKIYRLFDRLYREYINNRMVAYFQALQWDIVSDKCTSSDMFSRALIRPTHPLHPTSDEYPGPYSYTMVKMMMAFQNGNMTDGYPFRLGMKPPTTKIEAFNHTARVPNQVFYDRFWDFYAGTVTSLATTRYDPTERWDLTKKFEGYSSSKSMGLWWETAFEWAYHWWFRYTTEEDVMEGFLQLVVKQSDEIRMRVHGTRQSYVYDNPAGRATNYVKRLEQIRRTIENVQGITKNVERVFSGTGRAATNMDENPSMWKDHLKDEDGTWIGPMDEYGICHIWRLEGNSKLFNGLYSIAVDFTDRFKLKNIYYVKGTGTQFMEALAGLPVVGKGDNAADAVYSYDKRPVQNPDGFGNYIPYMDETGKMYD